MSFCDILMSVRGSNLAYPVNAHDRYWLVRTRRGGHVTWALAVPVGKHQRAAPEAYLSDVAEYYHLALGADPAFGGLSRNPAHPKADTVWGR